MEQKIRPTPIKEMPEKSFEITGINHEMLKLKDKTKDGYRRIIIDEIIKPYFPSKISDHLNKYIHIDFVKHLDKIICWIRINKGDSRVFLNLLGKEVFLNFCFSPKDQKSIFENNSNESGLLVKSRLLSLFRFNRFKEVS
jgi:hypothetical protein